MNIGFYTTTTNILEITLKDRKTAHKCFYNLVASAKQHVLLKFVIHIDDKKVFIKLKNDTVKERVINFFCVLFPFYTELSI